MDDHMNGLDGDPGPGVIAPDTLSDLNVEIALVAGMMHSAANIDAVSWLPDEAWTDPICATAAAAAIRMRAGGKSVTTALIARHIDNMPEETRPQNPQNWVLEAKAGHLSDIDARDYANLLDDLLKRRRLRDVLSSTQQSVLSDVERDADEIMAVTTSEVDHALETGRPGQSGDDLAGAASGILDRLERDEQLPGIATGIETLDAVTGRLISGRLWVAAGRPGMGKTVFATTVAMNAARQGKRVLFISREMSADDIATRLIAGAAGVSAARIQDGAVSLDEKVRIAGIVEGWGGMPFEIDDGDDCRVLETLVSKVRSRMRRRPVDLIIIDYLQLIDSEYARRSGGNSVAELTEITRGLKALARACEVPILLLSQLNRGVESRDDKRPQLSDLRGSGSIEQDADGIVFLYRHEYYLERAEPAGTGGDAHEAWQAEMDECRNVADIIVAKHRFGVGQSVKVVFDGAGSEFRDR